ncbi:astacin [Ancylostoma ceylanicum]|uniref:Metalloendopeptidase n=1 Tax=Ancylostoma ceylanicum TaxID=53326 RepID=A0A0D6M5F3_9BILA|nr:astacin [Ancylostoma ceylanicum]
MLRAIATTFLFVACISEIVLGNIARNGEDRHLELMPIQEVITRFDRYRRQAQAWGPGVVPTKRIDYFFKDGITSTERMLVTDEGTQCLYKRNRTGRGMKIMYVGCGYFGGAAHEVGHSLWLDHTHNRHDRDKHLDVNDKSIEVYKEQYKKLTTSENKNYDIPYDYGSIMHYGSSGPNPTMTPKDRKYHKTMGSPLISFTDLAMVNKHHNCEDSCRGKPTECANRGFPNPNNCDICVCPSGYGGDRCEDKVTDK